MDGTELCCDRVVFFLSGFDPKGASYYHRMYREGAAQRNAASPEVLTVSRRRREGSLWDSWGVEWTEGQQSPLRTRFEFMRWDDIVRRHWSRTVWQRVQDYWNIYVEGTRLGVLARFGRVSPPALFLAVLPLTVGLLVTAAGLTLATLLWPLVRSFDVLGGLGLGPWLLAAALASLWLWRRIERRLDSEWLLRLYGFCRVQARDELPELEARLDELARRVVDTVQRSNAREVLVVGYSTGGLMAMSVCARALAAAPNLGLQGPQWGLLTLGHCVPLLSSFPAAVRFRKEAAALADAPGLTWIDYSSPADWAAFAQVTPWPHAGRARLAMASPRFHAQMDAADYRRLKRDKLRLHLHYLRAPLRACGYDYFELTAGPSTLAERHARMTAPTGP